MQKFHTIFRWDEMAKDLVIEGIFTLKADAEIMRLDLTSAGFQRVARLELSMIALKEFLREERKGPSIRALCKMTEINKQIAEM